jgi:hypothetical protein
MVPAYNFNPVMRDFSQFLMPWMGAGTDIAE